MLDSYMNPTSVNTTLNQIDEVNKNRLDMTNLIEQQRGDRKTIQIDANSNLKEQLQKYSKYSKNSSENDYLLSGHGKVFVQAEASFYKRKNSADRA